MPTRKLSTPKRNRKKHPSALCRPHRSPENKKQQIAPKNVLSRRFALTKCPRYETLKGEGGDLPSGSEGCYPFISGRRPAGAWQGHLRSSEGRSSDDAAVPADAFHQARRGGVANPRPRWNLSRVLLQPFAAGHFGVSRIRQKDPGDTDTRAGFGKEAVKGVAP